MSDFKPLKDYVLESNSTHFRVVTDEHIIDALVDTFGYTRAEAIDRLSAIDFNAARNEIAEAA